MSDSYHASLASRIYHDAPVAGDMSLLDKERIMNRKEFVHVAGLGAAATAIGGIGGCRSGLTGSPSSASSKTVTAGSSRTRALYVANGRNRFDEEMMIWGVIPAAGQSFDG